MKNNNVLPEWVELNKKIHQNIQLARNTLKENYTKIFLEQSSTNTSTTSENTPTIFNTIKNWLLPGNALFITKK